MGVRLTGFDYTRPYFYMVTLRRLEGETESKTLSFTSEGKTLGFYVEGLMEALSLAYWEVCAKAGDEKAKLVVSEAKQTKRFAPVFFADWHDWIVKCDGQLAAFTRYIRENPARSWLRKSHREYFQRVNEIEFLGRKWYGYGNAALLELPVLEPFRCSRKWVENGPEWREAVARASRLGPGGASGIRALPRGAKSAGKMAWRVIAVTMPRAGRLAVRSEGERRASATEW